MKWIIIFFLATGIAYGGYVSPAYSQVRISASTAEIQLLNLINQHRRLNKQLAPLEIDSEASRICRFHSHEMKEEKYFSLNSPLRGSLQYKFKKNGIFPQISRAFILLDSRVLNIFNKLKTYDVLENPEITHVGIGFYVEDNTRNQKPVMWVTVVFLEKMAEFQRIPNTVSSGQRLNISGHLLNGYRNPRLPVTLPNGKVQHFYNQKNSASEFLFQFKFDKGPGKYQFELLVDHPEQGPKVAAIIPIYADMKYPPPERVVKPPQENFKNNQEAAGYMANLVNHSREKLHLPPLQMDQLLTYVAYQHSEDMAKNHYFAHINKEGKNANDRYQSNGGYGDVGENIAYDKTIQSAHEGLMNSPGHRANILNEDYTHIGIGIYYVAAEGQYYVTQLYRRKNELIDTSHASQDLINWLNQVRKSKGLSPLIQDPILVQTAEQHSKQMAIENSFSYESGGLDFYERFQKNGGRYRELDVNILLADSLENAISQFKKNMGNIMDKRFTHVGIGIYQGNSPDYGENVLWITLGLSTKL